MTRLEIGQMIKAIISEADYDLAKQLDRETAEDPDSVNYLMNSLIEIAYDHMGELLESHAWLMSLEVAGVDNWDGISYAHELHREYLEQCE